MLFASFIFKYVYIIVLWDVVMWHLYLDIDGILEKLFFCLFCEAIRTKAKIIKRNNFDYKNELCILRIVITTLGN